MPSVDDQINDARTAAARDRDAAAALSAKRLIELQKQSPRAAAQYWEDPTLTAKDRRAFLTWLRSKLPGQRPRHSMRRRMAWPPIGQVVGRYWRWVCLGGGVAAVLGTAAWNTPRIYWAQVTSDTVVEWHLDGAVAGYQTVPTGSTLQVIDQNGDSTVVRRWLERRGYLTGNISSAFLQLYRQR